MICFVFQKLFLFSGGRVSDEQFFIDLMIFISEYIENDLYVVRLPEIPDSADGDLCSFFFGKTEHACRNAAESNAFDPVLNSGLKAVSVTAFEKAAMFICQTAADDRADRVDHVTARQIVSVCDLCLSGRFFMTLRLYDPGAFISQADTGECMDAVIDAEMARLPTAGHTGIGCVDDRAASHRGDVAFPEENAVFGRFQIGNVGDARFGDQFRQERILGLQKKFIRFPGGADIDETSVKSEPFFFVIRYHGLSGVGTLRQQMIDQKKQFFILDDNTPV